MLAAVANDERPGRRGAASSDVISCRLSLRAVAEGDRLGLAPRSPSAAGGSRLPFPRPLPGQLVEALRAHRAAQLEEREMVLLVLRWLRHRADLHTLARDTGVS